MRSSRIVAEALRDVVEPVATVLGTPRLASGFTRHALEQASAAVARHGGCPPDFLRPEQVDPWRRVMAALEGWEGAILAEPLGSGKTWVALAVAFALRLPTTVLGPAALEDQWSRVSQRAGVRTRFHAMEALSRGRLPPEAPFVVIDEAHRLRDPATRRVRLVAPWLVGRRVLLLTATPIVNRRRDLLDLLALFTSDDALALDGVASLRTLASARTPPSCLARLVIRSGRGDHGVAVCTIRVPTGRRERARARRAVEAIDGLRLSEDPGIRQLVRSVLLDAAASSDAAFLAALRRYHHLLSQSRDAGGIGRAALRRFLGNAPDQLTMWSLLGPLDRVEAPPLDDLGRTASLLGIKAWDTDWMAGLHRLLGDGRITICFCRHRETARVLVRAWGHRVAWVIGSRAGIGTHEVSRHDVLAWFGPTRMTGANADLLPRVLIATEVLAEGLDLQSADRVVHVDLPWHDMRLRQRNGRVLRIGQAAGSVDVVHRGIPRSIESAFGQGRRVRAKGRASASWLAELQRPRPATVAPAGFWISMADGPGRDATCLVWLASGARTGVRSFRDDGHETVGMRAAPRSGRITPGDTGEHATLASTVAARAVRRALCRSAAPPAGSARLIAEILRTAREASNRRDGEQPGRLDRLLAVAARPGSRGVVRRLEEIEELGVARFRVESLPEPRPAREVTVVAVHVRLHPGPPMPLP